MWKTGTGEFSFCEKPELENSFFFIRESFIVENQHPRIFFFFYPRILVLWKTRIGEFFFLCYPRILVLWKTGTGEFSFCEKPESENFFFPRILLLWKTRIQEFFFFLSENSRFVENQNWRIFFFFYPRILVLWKTRIGEFFFFFIREFSFCGKREPQNSRFVKNQNWRIFFYFFYFFYPRILVLWKTGTGEFLFCEKPELENFFFLSERSPIVENQNPRIFFYLFFFLTENSRFVENRNWRFFFFFNPRILVLWKTRIGEFFFFIREFSFYGKWERENSRFVENQNRRIFFFLSENSRFVENGNWRIVVLWKTGIGKFFFIIFFFIREFSFCGNGEFSFGGKQELENSHFVENQNGRVFFFLFLSETSRFVENGNRRILVLWKTRIGEFFFFLSENSRFVENGNWRILVL